MKTVFGKFVCFGLGVVLLLTLTGRAQDRVVPPAELDRMVLEASRDREASVERVQEFIAGELAREVLASKGVDYEKVSELVPYLDSQELHRLAEQVEKAENDFAAGTLTNQQITYIIIALATAVIVLIAVN